VRLNSVIFLFALVSAPSWAAAGAEGTPPPNITVAQILERYEHAIEVERAHPKALSMEVDMDATLPRLKKEGRLHALRFMSRVGKIFYSGQRYEGDNTIKKEVIARYLQAEKEARADIKGSVAVTSENYKFKYKGITDYAGRNAYVFQVSPRKKLLGLYKGELWIDEDTYLPLREWGDLVKNPSVFLKNVYFVRDYAITGGISVPRRLISEISTRIVGKAELTIWYQNVKVGDTTAAGAAMLSAPAVAATQAAANGH
jgi:MucB/RseB N-terminal domain